MCGRYCISTLRGIERLGLQQGIQFEARYNVAPSQNVPVVVDIEGLKLESFKWGLIPHWAKDAKVGYRMINARAETVDAKPAFRTIFRRRRCLIPADGFYEWHKDGSVKQPYRITLKDESLFCFAGLWDSWQAPSGETINSCIIITTTPNELMANIHDRMPVILPQELETVWLDPEIHDTGFLKQMLRPYLADQMTAYEISTLVNSPKNNFEGIIAPL